jgi:hypothetical protein
VVEITFTDLVLDDGTNCLYLAGKGLVLKLIR